jgi:hypothetical protein
MKFYLNVESQQRWNSIRGGGCVAEVAGYGATILDLNAADFPGCAL